MPGCWGHGRVPPSATDRAVHGLLITPQRAGAPWDTAGSARASTALLGKTGRGGGNPPRVLTPFVAGDAARRFPPSAAPASGGECMIGDLWRRRVAFVQSRAP